MSEYQGLNLPQLMELVKPMVVPDPVSWLPATPGWWVLAGWLLMICLLAGWQRRVRWQADRYRREALTAIDDVLASRTQTADRAAAIAAVLKRTALAVYPRAEVAALTGTAWAGFLTRSAEEDALIAEHAQKLAAAAYRSDIDPDELVEPARRWIRRHRA